MKFGDFVKVKSLQSVENFKRSVQDLGLDIPCDEELVTGDASPMAKSIRQHAAALESLWEIRGQINLGW